MATVVKCDNPRCTATYEASSFLGGHTFTCNHCGSRVTIRDLSFIGSQSRSVRPQPRQRQSPLFGNDGRLLESIVAGHSRHRRLLKAIADHWPPVLFAAVFVAVALLLFTGHR